MTQLKHTPGPWTINEQTLVTTIEANGEYITSLPHKWRTKRTDANARLIAAAPDYDSAAELAITQMEQCLKLVGDDEEFLEALNALKAAQEKARGEA